MEELRIYVDSGAVDTVAPRDAATSVQLEDSEASKQGMHYTAAHGTHIQVYGQKSVYGLAKKETVMSRTSRRDIAHTSGIVERVLHEPLGQQRNLGMRVCRGRP